jgi:hypothetical protein
MFIALGPEEDFIVDAGTPGALQRHALKTMIAGE